MTLYHSQFYLKINGVAATIEMMGDLRSVEVDDSLHMPMMITLEFHDPGLKWVDDTSLKVGAALTVSARGTGANAAEEVLGIGEITAIEPHYQPRGALSLVVTAMDRSHRLHHSRKTRTYLQQTDGDIVKKIASECGLSAQTGATSEVYKHILQDNQTDYDFLAARARRLGFVVKVKDRTLLFKKPADIAGGGAPVRINWGEELLDFRPRLTGAAQSANVTVRGWDPATKRPVVGKVSSPTLTHRLSTDGHAALTSGGITAGAHAVVDVPVNSQSEAQTIAASMLDELRNGDIFAEGTAAGNGKIKTGCTIRVGGVGTRFGGSYMATRVRHVYDYDAGWLTHFEMTNGFAETTSELVGSEAGTPQSRGRNLGPGIGLVTNVKDPEGMGRVTVKFPWLDDSVESNWARVVAPMAGNNYGFQFMPEVNDEVLVAFEHGDVNRPYVLGGVWNGRDKPPVPTSVFLSGGAVVVRELKTPQGHILRFTDKPGGEKIEVIDKTGKNKMTFDSSTNEIDIEAQMKVLVKASEITLDAKMKALVKAVNIEMKATGTMKLEAAGPVEVKGAVIKLN